MTTFVLCKFINITSFTCPASCNMHYNYFSLNYTIFKLEGFDLVSIAKKFQFYIRSIVEFSWGRILIPLVNWPSTLLGPSSSLLGSSGISCCRSLLKPLRFRCGYDIREYRCTLVSHFSNISSCC